jgi:hypothetical protein
VDGSVGGQAASVSVQRCNDMHAAVSGCSRLHCYGWTVDHSRCKELGCTRCQRPRRRSGTCTTTTTTTTTSLCAGRSSSFLASVSRPFLLFKHVVDRCDVGLDPPLPCSSLHHCVSGAAHGSE